MDMLYETLATFYEKIENTSSRIAMTELLVKLFKDTPSEILDKVIYLTQGKLRPDYEGIEIGIAEKLALRALSQVSGLSIAKLEELLRKLGDIGLVGERVLENKQQVTLISFFGDIDLSRRLTVNNVYSSLMKIATLSGPGSQEQKINTLVKLLGDAKPKEAKYLLRTITGKLRLGIADMTILDALSITFTGSKNARDIIERAYNIHPDLGYIAKLLAEKGLKGVSNVRINVGIPVLPMLAERLSSPKEILEKMGGRCQAEYKYDGERVQAHKKDKKVILFSRRLENITSHYPDVVNLIINGITAKEVIVEGEIVAINADTGEMLPFQELMHRRRKYGIKEAMEKYPASVFLFDVLYADNRELIEKPLPERRKTLESIVKQNEKIKLSEARIISTEKELELFFEQAISEGCEGLMCKSISSESIYKMGARGWLWIKFKRDYRYEMTDTVDLVVVGAFYGRGRRKGTYGALLMAAYDPKSDMFKTVCKVGSGFTDEDLRTLPEKLEPYKIPHRHARVFSNIEPDVWFVPAIVLEIIGAEITLSPLHTCGFGKIKPDTGLAIRFPRFTGRYRLDKKPEQATTEDELIEMYKQQKRTK